jgi:hypothetical protein
MKPKLRWLSWIVVGWIVIAAAIRAFLGPWTWNAAQWEFVILLAIASIGPAMWGYIWMRDGAEGVKARRAALRAAAAARPLSKRFYVLSVAFWIGVALILVVLFNVLDKSHH